MKLCFSTLGCTERSLEDILLLAKKYNIHALEVRGIDGQLDNRLIPDFGEDRQAETTALFRRYGVDPLVMGTSCRFHNAEQLEASMEEGFRSIEIAERMGFSYIRVFGDRLLPEDTEGCIRRAVEGLTALCNHAKTVDVLLEVHGDFNTVEALTPIVEDLQGHPRFGLIWDVAHSHKAYRSGWETFYNFARPYVKHVHIKDFSEEKRCLTLIGEGDAPILPIVDRLLADGYDGCFSLEWEKKWHPELPEIEQGLESFTTLLNQWRK